MIIYIGADHRGFALKEQLKGILKEEAYEVVDVGAAQLTPGDDYPDYAKLVAAKVSESPSTARGILICGSGSGADIVANKFMNVRSVLGISTDHVYQVRHDDDANVLSIAADFIDPDMVLKMVKIFLSTPLAGDERYARRLQKIAVIEANRP
jgi:RpiB/LacA/LacB family sugar-phosphate isomerase